VTNVCIRFMQISYRKSVSTKKVLNFTGSPKPTTKTQTTLGPRPTTGFTKNRLREHPLSRPVIRPCVKEQL
jgi:hypothetical protein